MNIHDLLSRLSGVHPTGRNQWRSICPSCGKLNRSKFAVRLSDTGAILVHCFAGCDVGSVADALGIELHDLFPDRDIDRPSGARSRPENWPAKQALAMIKDDLDATASLLTVASHGQLTDAMKQSFLECAGRIREARRIAGL